MTQFRRRAIVALSMLAATAGCSFMQRQAFKAPDVYVSDVRLTGVGTQGGKIDIVLAIYNPNNFRLDGSNLHYKALVDSVLIGEGTVEKRVTIEKRDSGEVRVPVTFGFREILEAAQKLTKRGSLPFEIAGDLKVETAFGSTTRKFSQRGTYDGVNISVMPPRK
jgi:LEA14-like dessication related protein